MIFKWLIALFIININLLADNCNSKSLNVVYINGVGNLNPPVFQNSAIEEMYVNDQVEADRIFF